MKTILKATKEKKKKKKCCMSSEWTKQMGGTSEETGHPGGRLGQDSELSPYHAHSILGPLLLIASPSALMPACRVYSLCILQSWAKWNHQGSPSGSAFSSCVTLGLLPNISEPQLSQL